MIWCCNIPPRPLVEKPVKEKKKTEKKWQFEHLHVRANEKRGFLKICLDTKRENLPPGRRWSWQSHLVNGELVAKVVDDVVGGCGKAAGGCENKVGSHEEIGDVCCGDVASDGLVAAGGAVVC